MSKSNKPLSNQQLLNRDASLKASSLTTTKRMFPYVKPGFKIYKGIGNSYNCDRELINVNGMVERNHKTYSCGQRWCVKCNKKKTALLMAKYVKPIIDLKDVYLLTLTARVVTDKNLPERIDQMNNIWRKIFKNANKFRIELNGIRKLECVTAKNHPTKYHPHYHVIIQGIDQAEFIRDKWLQQWRKAYPKDKGIISNKAQNITKVYGKIENAALEIFKYLTPMVHQHKDKEGNVTYVHDDPKMLVHIYETIYKKRSIAPFGTLVNVQIEEKEISEIEENFKRKWPEKCKTWKVQFDHETYNWKNPFDDYLSTFKPKNPEYKKFLDDYPKTVK